MTAFTRSNHTTGLKEILIRKDYDFSAKYLAAKRLNEGIKEDLGSIHPEVIPVIESLYHDPAIRDQTQCYFLYKELSRALCAIGVGGINGGLDQAALSAVFKILAHQSGHAHRATAEALGSLPFGIHGPDLRREEPQETPWLSLHTVLIKSGVEAHGGLQWRGRSMVVPLDQKGALDHAEGRILVLKLNGSGPPSSLFRECQWMDFLSEETSDRPVSFRVPRVIRIHGAPVFRLDGNAPATPSDLRTFHGCHAVAFITHWDYFAYPNDADPKRRLSPGRFRTVMLKNAMLFGHLTAQGALHSAPIPLFHNRVQASRRRDGGVYEWQQGGRLDRWLASCRYPNFGCSGLRDFEHFSSFNGISRMLYPHVGTQLLSLLLVAGSYFRNRHPNELGLKPDGTPVDVRHLFDTGLLGEWIRGMFDAYYQGFCGSRFSGELPVNMDRLTHRMVEEMGVDHHMEEILRVADQHQMEAPEFRRFLEDRGFTREAARRIPKGVADVTLHTGPHLGGFNQRISLPEMTEAVGAMAAVCMLGKYRQRLGLDPIQISS